MMSYETLTSFVTKRPSLEKRARHKIRHQISRYPAEVKDYLEPVIQNDQLMEVAAKTFSMLDEDPKLLAKISTAFLQGLGSISDKLNDVAKSSTPKETEWGLDYDDSDDESGEPLEIGNTEHESIVYKPKNGPNNNATSTEFMQLVGLH